MIEALEAPRSPRDERALRKVFAPETGDGEQLSRDLVRVVRERGFQPWKAPEPLSPITADDIALVVWMAVDAERVGVA